MIRIQSYEKKENYKPEYHDKKEKTEEFSQEEIKQHYNDTSFKVFKSELYYNFYHYYLKCVYFIFKTIIFLFKISGIYLLWICLHFFSAHLYTKFCVPNSLVGFLMSPFLIATPHCQGLRWIVYNAATIINNMWIFIGTWIYSMIWIVNNKQPSNT